MCGAFWFHYSFIYVFRQPLQFDSGIVLHESIEEGPCTKVNQKYLETQLDIVTATYFLDKANHEHVAAEDQEASWISESMIQAWTLRQIGASFGFIMHQSCPQQLHCPLEREVESHSNG